MLATLFLSKEAISGFMLSSCNDKILREIAVTLREFQRLIAVKSQNIARTVFEIVTFGDTV